MKLSLKSPLVTLLGCFKNKGEAEGSWDLEKPLPVFGFLELTNNLPSQQSIYNMAPPSEASLRWSLLRHHLLSRGGPMKDELVKISRRPHGSFGLIMFEKVNSNEEIRGDEEWTGKEPKGNNVFFKYTLPSNPRIELVLLQRKEDEAQLSDLTFSTKHEVDMTGLVGLWPAEEVLTHFCINNPSIFRNKRVLELGSGYGLAGLAIATCTDASEVVLTDGNPQVLQYVEHNIFSNSMTFGKTEVRACVLRWGKELPAHFFKSFDIVVAADCTFFSGSHVDLAQCVESLLKRSSDSRAFFFNPERDGTLYSFVQQARSSGLDVECKDQYDDALWVAHQRLIQGKTPNWINYSSNHCYPLLTILKLSNI